MFGKRWRGRLAVAINDFLYLKVLGSHWAYFYIALWCYHRFCCLLSSHQVFTRHLIDGIFRVLYIVGIHLVHTLFPRDCWMLMYLITRKDSLLITIICKMRLRLCIQEFLALLRGLETREQKRKELSSSLGSVRVTHWLETESVFHV